MNQPAARHSLLRITPPPWFRALVWKEWRQQRSIFLAILWKEWRESWWLLLFTVLTPAAASLAWPHIRTSFWLIPLMNVLLGARLFASERARGTSIVQAERPAGRGTVWNATLMLPAMAVIFELCLTGIILWRVAAPEHSPAWSNFPLAVFAGLTAFLCAVFSSTLLDRPITAIGAALVMLFGMGALVVFVVRPGSVLDSHLYLFGISICAVSLALVPLSRHIYVRLLHH